MKFFVLVYDKQAGELREEHEFAASDRLRAFEQRQELMLRYRVDPNIEVALLGSESRANLTKTHSRYFKPLQELAHGA
jgi:hypothetical protein